MEWRKRVTDARGERINLWEIENEKRENRTDRIEASMSVKRMRTIVGINNGAIITLLILSMVSVQVLSTGSVEYLLGTREHGS